MPVAPRGRSVWLSTWIGVPMSPLRTLFPSMPTCLPVVPVHAAA
jgi:hypothetical protein